jgi:hypothetical protein
LRLCNSDFDVNYELPAAGWEKVGTPVKSYRYRSKTGPIRTVDIKGGKQIKVTGRDSDGGPLGHSLATNPNPLDIVLRTGDTRYCMRYGGEKTAFIPGRIFKSKNALPPPACPNDPAP